MTIAKRMSAVFLVLLAAASSASAAVTVYMADASEIEAQSAWKQGDRVYLQVTPDLRLDFPVAEVDLRRSKIGESGRTAAPPAPEKGSKGPAQAKAVPPLDELLEIAGIRRDFNDLFRRSVTDDDLDRVLKGSFSPEGAEKTIKGHIQRSLAPRELSEVLAWYRGPLAQKIVEAESVYDFNRKEKMYMYLGMDSQPEFKERMDLISRIEKASGTAEVEARLIGNIFRKMLNAIPPDYPDAAEIKDRIRKEIPSTDKLRKGTTDSWAYTYRDLSTNELRLYLKFLRSTSGKKFMAATHGALEEIFGKLAVTMEKNLRNDLMTIMKAGGPA